MDENKLVSLTEARNRKITSIDNDDLAFQKLFSMAQQLRSSNLMQEQSGITVLDLKGAKDFFHVEIAEDVFQQKLFSRSILMSIWFVSDLLTSFMEGDIQEVGIVRHVRRYNEDGDPNCLLKAANSAFLYFVFWPETRRRSQLEYRKYGLERGPSLYAQYGSVTSKPFGFYMAKAFQPIGEIVRKRIR